MASIIATQSQRELIPAGNYLARCFQLIEIGTVTDTVMGHMTTSKKCRIGWELPTEMRVFDPEKGEQPLMISAEYTLSTSKKSNLRAILASWRGRDFTEDEAKKFDIMKILGAPCMLNIIHKAGVSDPTRLYEKIAGITPVPKGMKVPSQINPSMILAYDDWNEDLFKKLPSFVQDRIISSEEFQQMVAGGKTILAEPEEVQYEDDLPF